MKLSTLTQFGQSIDPTKCRVESFPKLIAVFGGPTNENPTELNISKRNVLIQWLKENNVSLHNHVVTPESYTSWQGQGEYKNLLDFEKDLGHLTASVVIFLEGPGSFAELGAFSQISSLAPKLLVVIASEHHQNKSFISLGPIRELYAHDNDSIFEIPSKETEDLEQDIDLVVERLEQRNNRPTSPEKLNLTSTKHHVLTALDLIDLFACLTNEEIRQGLNGLRIEVDLKRVNQLLFLFSELQLVKSLHFGGQIFYMPIGIGRYTFLDYGATSSSRPFNRSRWRVDCFKEILTHRLRRRVCEIHFGKEVFQLWTS